MKVSARRQAAGLVSDSARKVELYVVFRHYKDLECQIDHLFFFSSATIFWNCKNAADATHNKYTVT